MKMVKTFTSYMLLIVSVWTRLHLLVADTDTANPVWIVCQNSEYGNGSDFQRNLNQLLESMVENGSTSEFKTSVEGQNSDSTVYGFVQCRGDFNSSDCKGWISQAKEKLLQSCHKTSGLIQIDGCLLRYDNYNFYDNYNQSSESTKFCNQIKSNVPEQFGNTTGEVLSKIIEKAVQSPKHFATDKFETTFTYLRELYSLAQCWGDLSQTNCRSCLAAGRSIISGDGRSNMSAAGCETGAIGARYLSTNCVLRYEIYSFFNTSIISTPISAGGKRSKGFWITLGVLAATLGSIAAIAAIGLWKWNIFSHRKPWEKNSRTRGEKGEIDISLSISNPELIFKYDILREAASNFEEKNKLGEGGFGSVFKGVLPDSREIAIKRLNRSSRQGDTEFLNEANLICRVQHRNLVKLLGCCVESSERLLVYEYLQNSSLDKILFGSFWLLNYLIAEWIVMLFDFFQCRLSTTIFTSYDALIADTTKRHLLHWKDRYEIIVGVARGLAYLHEESQIRIIHRDIKASNILLDDKLRPKIADFGLAKFLADDQSHVSTGVAGTLGYMAPEYALRGQLTEKADVFSFGVLLLEIISGRKNQSLPQHPEFLIEATWRLYKEERTLEVMDPTLEGSYSPEEAIKVIKIGLLCTQAAPGLRPSMTRVVSMVTSDQEHFSSPTRPVFIDLDCMATPHQVQRLRVIDPDKISSSTGSSTSTFGIYSVALDPSSGTLGPR